MGRAYGDDHDHLEASHLLCVVPNATRTRHIHVFESFQRVGKQSGSARSEEFEVVLAEWLLDNLNTNYAISEDFVAYRQLKRPTAKGIFGPLHLWFKASQGRAVEKDYRQLCMLLGIQPYAYLSKIKSTMGKALDELVTVRYLSRWDVQPMSSKDGYKIVLWPGEDLLRSLALSAPRLQSAAPNAGLLGNIPEQLWKPNQARTSPWTRSRR